MKTTMRRNDALIALWLGSIVCTGCRNSPSALPPTFDGKDFSLSASESKLGPAGDEEMRSATTDPGNTHYAFVQADGSKKAVVLDGNKGPAFDDVNYASLTFSKDGAHIGYSAKTDGKWVAVVDGRTGPPFDAIAEPQGLLFADASASFDSNQNTAQMGRLILSPDGRRAAYGAQRGGQWSVVVDGVAGPGFKDVGDIQFTPDGAHVVYGAFDSKGWRLVWDGKQSEPFHGYGQGSLHVSPDGHLAWCESQGGLVVLRDGAPTTEFKDAIGHLAVSVDGKHEVHLAKSSGGIGPVLDGKAGPASSDDIQMLILSPEGSHYLAGGGHEKSWFIGLDGKKWDVGESISISGDFSPDGRHAIGFLEKAGSWTAMLDGKAYGAPATGQEDGVPFGEHAFSPDSRHVVYATLADKKWKLLVDGQPGPAYDRTIDGSKVVFDGPSSLHMVYVRDGNAYRGNVTLAPK
jgi:hypothetical protein